MFLVGFKMHEFYKKLKDDVRKLNDREIPLDQDGNEYLLN